MKKQKDLEESEREYVCTKCGKNPFTKEITMWREDWIDCEECARITIRAIRI